MQQVLTAIYAEVLPILLQLIAAALGLILLRASEAARARWGIEIEARHREALQSALMSGISAALTRGLRGDAAIQAGIAYAHDSVPDALAALKPDPKVLRSLAEAKFHQSSPLHYIGIDTAKPEVPR
jgi:hypothetical protein